MRITLLLSAVALSLLTACGSENSPDVPGPVAAGSKNSAPLTTIQWIDSAQDYGSITEGQRLALSFHFKNSGDKPLVIESVKPTCGCTIANYPKEPIAPGEEGEITGEFDSNGREGLQHKHMTVRSNVAQQAQDISFQVNVLPRRNANAN
jgi:hypothetical protein